MVIYGDQRQLLKVVRKKKKIPSLSFIEGDRFELSALIVGMSIIFIKHVTRLKAQFKEKEQQITKITIRDAK